MDFGRRWVVLAATAALAFAFPVDAFAAEESFAVAGKYRVRLDASDAGYGQESWKYDAAYYQVGPNANYNPDKLATHASNATTSYFAALGYRVILRITITNPDGSAITNSDYLAPVAYIETPRGRLYAYVAKQSVSTFTLTFDADGSNNADYQGRVAPPLPGGFQLVHVDIVRSDPTTTLIEASDELSFYYERPAQAILVPAVGPGFHEAVPDAMFRPFNDIGYDNFTEFFIRPIGLDSDVTLAYEFGRPGFTVTFTAWTMERGACAPSPPGPSDACVPVGGSSVGGPNLPVVSSDPNVQKVVAGLNSMVQVRQKDMGTAVTDANGTATKTFKASDAIPTGYPVPGVPGSPSTPSALVVMSAHLVPTGNLSVVAGSSESVLPISGKRHYIRSLQPSNTDFMEAAKNGSYPSDFYELARSVATLSIADVDANSPPTNSYGDAFALANQGAPSPVLSKTALSRDTSPSRSGEYRVGTMPVRAIQDQHISHYRVYAIMYEDAAGPAGTKRDVFSTVTFADRGYEASLYAPVVRTGQAATLYLNLTSRTTNYDAVLAEPQLSTRVLVRIQGQDVEPGLRVEAVDIPEAETVTYRSVHAVPGPDKYTLAVELTSGDTLPPPYEAVLTVVEPPAKRRVGIPGFELVALAAALAGAILLVSRRF